MPSIASLPLTRTSATANISNRDHDHVVNGLSTNNDAPFTGYWSWSCCNIVFEHHSVIALKLFTAKDVASNKASNAVQALRDRVCESCGRILILCKTKRFRIKSRIRNRTFDLRTLAMMNRRGKRMAKINYSVETCLECNHRKYSKEPFTSFAYFKAQRLNKMKRITERTSFRKMAQNTNSKDHANRLKANRNRNRKPRNDGNQIMEKLKNIKSQRDGQRKGNNVNTKKEVNRLMTLTDSKGSTSRASNIKNVVPSKRRKKLPTASTVKFRRKKRRFWDMLTRQLGSWKSWKWI